MNQSDLHEIECQQQPDGFPCNCDEVKEKKEAILDNAKDAEATGN